MGGVAALRGAQLDRRPDDGVARPERPAAPVRAPVPAAQGHRQGAAADGRQQHALREQRARHQGSDPQAEDCAQGDGRGAVRATEG